MPTAHHRKDCPTCQSPGPPLNGCQHLWHIEVRLTAPTGPEPEERPVLLADLDAVAGIIDLLEERHWPMSAAIVRTLDAERDQLAAQVSALLAVVARLEGERDRSRRTAEQMEGERDEARTEVAATKHFRGRLHKQINAMRPVVEAAVAFRGIWGTTTSDDTTVGPTYRALIAAVDQMEVSTQDAPPRAGGTPHSDENGSGVAQDVAEAETGAQGQHGGRIVARTLRYVAGWIEDETVAADLIRRGADIEAGKVMTWACCVVCAEVRCDDDCPLYDVRKAAGMWVEVDHA